MGIHTLNDFCILIMYGGAEPEVALWLDELSKSVGYNLPSTYDILCVTNGGEMTPSMFGNNKSWLEATSLQVIVVSHEKQS